MHRVPSCHNGSARSSLGQIDADERNAFFSMLKKDATSHKVITADYINHWEANGVSKDSDYTREVRKDSYMALVNK